MQVSVNKKTKDIINSKIIGYNFTQCPCVVPSTVFFKICFFTLDFSTFDKMLQG